MKISKNSDSNKINFLDQFVQSRVEDKSKQVKSRDIDKSIQSQRAKKMDNSKAIQNISGKSILSAGGYVKGGISDFGGSGKYIGCKSNNSIWDSQVIQKQAKTKGGDQVIKQSRQAIQTTRQNWQKDRMNQIVQALQKTDTRKQSSVKSLSSQVSHTPNNSKSSISMFDNMDFQNLPQKTAGQKMSQQKNKQKKKDYIKNVGTKKLSDSINNLFTKDQK